MKIAPYVLLAVLAVACVTATETLDGGREYHRGGVLVATETADGTLSVTGAGEDKGYRVEQEEDGTDLLVWDAEVATETAKPWVPAPLQPLLPLFGYVASRLATKRGRRKAKDFVKSTIAGKADEAVKDVAGYFGYVDSHDAKTAYMRLRKKLVMEGAVDPESGLPFEFTSKSAPFESVPSLPPIEDLNYPESLGAVGAAPEDMEA